MSKTFVHYKMKTLTFILTLALLSLSTKTVYAQSENFTLASTWEVVEFNFAAFSAMDKNLAQEWIGKKAVIKRLLYFEYNEIKSYLDLFENYSYCNFRHDQNRESVLTQEYFNNFNIDPQNLGVTQEELLIIHTICRGTPFQDIIVKSSNEIIIFWDGTFFTLKRTA